MMRAIPTRAMKKSPGSPPPPSDLFLLNRQAYIVKPTRHFLQWLASVGTSSHPMPDEIEPTVDLLGEEDETGPEAFARCLGRDWSRIAEEEFNAWWTDRSDWPEIRGLPGFFEYFECSIVDMVFDLERKPIKRELA